MPLNENQKRILIVGAGPTGLTAAVEFARRITENDLDGYSESRHEAGADTIATSERARKMLTSSNFLPTLTVSIGTRLINILPPLQYQVAKIFLGG